MTRQLSSEEMVRPERPSSSQMSRDVTTPRSAAKPAVERPAAATEPRSRLLIFIVDLQSQSFVLPGFPDGLPKRDHTCFVCVAVALRPTNDPMHGFALPTLRRTGRRATA